MKVNVTIFSPQSQFEGDKVSFEWDSSVLPRIGEKIDYSVLESRYFESSRFKEEEFEHALSIRDWKVKDIVWYLENDENLTPTFELYGLLKQEHRTPVTISVS